MDGQIKSADRRPIAWLKQTVYTRLPRQVVRFLGRLPAELLAATLVGGLALFTNTRYANLNSLWFDESYSVNIASQPLSVLWGYIWGHEAHMGLYYILLHVWLGLTSLVGIQPTELVVRLPSILSATLSAIVVLLFGWRFWGRLVGILASLLFIFNFLALMQAQLTRSYALEVLFVCLSWYALLAALSNEDSNSRRWWIAYAVCAALAVYAQVFSLLILAAQVGAYAGFMLLPCRWQTQARQSWRSMAVSLAGVAILVSPVTIDALIHGGANYWVPVATRQDIHDLFINLSGNLETLMQFSLALCALGVTIAILYGIPATRSLLQRLSLNLSSPALPDGRIFGRPRPGILALACWLLIPLVLAYIATKPYLNEHLFLSRYLVVIAPAYCLLIAVGVSAVRPRALGFAIAILLVYLMVIRSGSAYYYSAPEPWRGPALWLEQHYQPGDGVICSPDYRCGMSLAYYLHAYPSNARLDGDSPGAWIWSRFENPANPVTMQTVTSYASGHSRIFLVSLIGRQWSPTDHRPMQVNRYNIWLSSHYHLVGHYSATSYSVTITVWLYSASP